jgi:hypothetical protein
VSARVLAQIEDPSKVERCECSIRTITGVKPLTWETEIKLEPLLGVRRMHRVHVVALRSPIYDVILGSDLMDWAGCCMKVQGGQSRVKQGRRLFVCEETLPPQDHVVVSALRVATDVQVVRN